jgi:hypothetical protein
MTMVVVVVVVVVVVMMMMRIMKMMLFYCLKQQSDLRPELPDQILLRFYGDEKLMWCDHNHTFSCEVLQTRARIAAAAESLILLSHLQAPLDGTSASGALQSRQ